MYVGGCPAARFRCIGGLRIHFGGKLDFVPRLVSVLHQNPTAKDLEVHEKVSRSKFDNANDTNALHVEDPSHSVEAGPPC